MKVTFTQTIELKPHHVRMLRMLKKSRQSWKDSVIGRALDDLVGWGLVEQSRTGAELYSVSWKGLAALEQIDK